MRLLIIDSSTALSRTPKDLFADVLLLYIPTFILRGAMHLPTRAFRALRSFRSVTDAMGARFMEEKSQLPQTGVEQDTDIMSILSESSGHFAPPSHRADLYIRIY
jgi:hypothetical protein